jgi:hypothetical protein
VVTDYPPNYTPNEPPDDLDDAVRSEWQSIDFRGAWARAAWELPNASLYLCCVCGGVVPADADGRRRFEGMTWQGSKAWGWGPYPCHDACRVDIRTPLDDNPRAVPTWERI